MSQITTRERTMQGGDNDAGTSRDARGNIIKVLRAVLPSYELSVYEQQRYAEFQAARLLQLTQFDGPPVPQTVISEVPRIEVEVGELPVHGYVVWVEDRWVITLAARDSVARQRHTLAHEFKHVLDHPFYDHLYTNRHGYVDEAHAEAMAEYFSMCLLMPRDCVLLAWHQGLQTTASLRRLFQVPHESMAERMWQLGLSGTGPVCGRYPARRHRQSPGFPIPGADQ